MLVKQYLTVIEIIFVLFSPGFCIILILGFFRKSKDPVKKEVKVRRGAAMKRLTATDPAVKRR